MKTKFEYRRAGMLLAIVLCTNPLYAATPVDLNQTLKLSADNAIRTRIAGAQLEQAHARYDGARAAYFPRVDLLAKSKDSVYEASPLYDPPTYDTYAQAQVSLRYTLLDFGQRKNALAGARSSVSANEEALHGEVEGVAFDALHAYLDTVRFRLLSDYAESYTQSVEKLHGTISEMVTGGLSPRSDAIRSSLALSNAKNRKNTVDLQLSKARQGLRSITGEDVEPVQYSLPGELPAVQVEPLVASAVDANPAVKARRLDVESNKSLVAAERASRYPRIDIVGAYRKPFQNVASPGSFIGVQMTLNLLDGGAARSRIAEAGASKHLAEAQLEQTERSVRDQAETYLSEWRTAKAQWQLNVDAERQAAKTLDLYADEFRLGTRSLSDLINAQSELYQAQSERVNAAFTYYLSTLSVYGLNGSIEEGLHALNMSTGGA